jgi:hypothetical protein
MNSQASDATSLVVVELFTSQGDSASPPADAFLAELARRPDIFAIAFHVDYWNYLGWTDPFSSKLAAERQRSYAKRLALRYVYTPQMVIDGTTEGIGSERDTITQLIADAAADPLPRISVRMVRESDAQVMVHIGDGALREPATVWLVGFDGEHDTLVKWGENEGHVLRDVHAVRSLKQVAVWSGAALDIPIADAATGGDRGLGILVQLNGTGRIIGAGYIMASGTRAGHEVVPLGASR